jgi:hypothetical protein
MYGIKYKVPFKTLSGRDSVVTLEERGYAGSVIELIAGGTPFIINIDQSDLLAPIRSSTATLTVVGSEYLQNLYTNDPQGIRVKCEVDGAVKWLGYLLPDTFSQDFSSSEFEYEMEVVSAFSTLKYKEFDLTDDFVTFWDIINEARILAGYQDIYYTNSVKAETSDYFSLKIASANFYDELGEAMTYYEILEEIAKFAGCCWVPYEDDLYFIDYQAIRSGYTSYTRIPGEGLPVLIPTTLQDLKTVTNYKGTGAKLSRIAGKNKAVVNCSLYEIENILPSIEDNVINTGTLKSTIGSKGGGKKDKWHYIVSVPAHVSGDKLQVPPRAINEPRSNFFYTTRYTEDAVPNKLNFDLELRVLHYVNKNGAKLTPNDIIMSVKSENELFIHDKVFFSFSCNLMTGVEGTTVSGEDGLIMYEPWGTALSDTTKTMPLKLRIGEYYYNGTTWTKTETKFNTFFLIKKDEKEHGRFITTRDDNTYTLGIGDLSGTIINPPSQTIVGEMELTLYTPDISIVNTRYGLKYSFIKDIKLDYAVQDLEGVYRPDKYKEDVIYESIPNEAYVEEADEINLKICTNTDGKLAFSSILEGDNFLSEIRTDVFGTGVAEEILLQRVVSLFSKPRFNINPTLENNAKPYTLFTEPHLNRQFLVAGGEEDVKMERATYNLIEA